MRRSAAVVASVLLVTGSALVVSQLTTAWVDMQLGWKKQWIESSLIMGLILVFLGVAWCVWIATTEDGAGRPSFDHLLARLGFALVATGLVTFIALFGLASRGLLQEVLGTEVTATAPAPLSPGNAENRSAAPVTEVAASKGLDERTPRRAAVPSESERKGRERVIWASRMALLPSFAVLGSLFFVCGRLRFKRKDDEDEGDASTFDSGRFWSGFWYRVGEGILFGLVAFLASYQGFIDGKKEWSGSLLLLGLLMAMFVKPAEQLVNGLAQRLFESVAVLTDRTLNRTEGNASHVLTPIITRLNDASETVRLQAIRELEQKANSNYGDVVDALASFVRQRAQTTETGVPLADVARAFGVLTTLAPPRGTPRAAPSLRGAVLRGVQAMGANLAGFDLTSVDFSNANLEKSDFTGADITATSFIGASLRGARLKEVKSAAGAKFEGATLDDLTTLPEGVASRLEE